MGLDELVLNQEITAEGIGFLRNDIAEFVRELKRDRMDLLEILQESRRDPAPPPTPEPAGDESKRAEPTDKANKFLSSLFSPKGLIAGLSAASLALYAFRDDVSKNSKSFSDSLLQMFPSFMRPGDPGDPDDKSLTTTVTGNGERLLVRATKTEAAQKAVAATTKITGTTLSSAAAKGAEAVKGNVVGKVVEKYGSAPEQAPRLAQKIMETATGPAIPKEPGAAAKSIKSVAKTVVSGAGKSALKTLPLIGAVAGVAFGMQRLLDGDPVGAALDISAGLAGGSGVGAPAAVAGNVYSLSRDVYNSVYETEDRKFPFEGDLIDDAEMVKERMTNIIPAVLEAIKEGQDDGESSTMTPVQKRRAQRSRGRPNSSNPLGDGPPQVATVSDSTPGGSPRAGISTRQQVSEPLIQGTMSQVASTGSVNVTTVNAPSNVTTQNNVAQNTPPAIQQPTTSNSSLLDAYMPA
ncbi:hypothetical protein N9A42_00100 [bacterium]|nr:hypothetical protein [bacterium]